NSTDRSRPPVPGPSRRGHHARCRRLFRIRMDRMSMLSVIVFLPLVAAAVLAAIPAIGAHTARWTWVALSSVEVILIGVLWARFESPGTNELAFEEQVAWIPGVGASYHVGVDGLSLPLLAMTALVFLACAIYAV